MESIALLKFIIWEKRGFFHSLTVSGFASSGFRSGVLSVIEKEVNKKLVLFTLKQGIYQNCSY